MRDITTSKEKLLKKIRKALLEKRDNPYPQLEDLPLYPATDEMPEVIFAEQFTNVAGQFVFCEDELQFIENLLTLAEERKWHKIYCWEPKLQEILNQFEYPHYETDKDFEQAEVGFTLCEALIARNGSILLSNGNMAGRRLSIYPSVHIVLAYTSQNNIFSGLFVGQNLVTIKQVDSTNSFLKNLLSNSKPVPEGTVIMAEEQYAGRGQQQNTWHSEPGKNLTFSILLKPHFLSVDAQFDLNRAVSLGVHDALQLILGDRLKIKWPNDIYYADRKLGGILIENTIQSGLLKDSVIGIGLNINQENFPPGASNATSVKQILQKDYDLTRLLSEICKHIEVYYLKLKAGQIDFVRDTYLNRLYWLNEVKRFESNNRVFDGSIKNVLPNGLLVIEDTNGQQLEFNLKELKFLNK